MNKKQLLKLIYNNRELILRHASNALNDLQALKNDYAQFADEEIFLHLELNTGLASAMLFSEYENALDNSLQIIEKFSATTYHNLLGRHYWLIGKCYVALGKHEESEKYLSIALSKLNPAQKEFVTLKTDILVALTMNEQEAGRGSEKSIAYLTEALALLKENHEHIVRTASCYMALGNVYVNANNAARALENYFLATEIYERLFGWTGIASGYSNIGTCYILTKEYDKAEEFLNRSLELRIKDSSPENICISYLNLALVYKETDRFDLAEEMLLKCREIITSINHIPLMKKAEETLAEMKQAKLKMRA